MAHHRHAALVVLIFLSLTATFAATAQQPAPPGPSAPPPAAGDLPTSPRPADDAPPAEKPAKSEKTKVFEAANCRFTLPTGWTYGGTPAGTVLLNAKRVVPPSSFALATEKIPPHPSDSPANDSGVSLFLLSEEGAEVRVREPMTVAGIIGEVAVVEGGKEKNRFRTVVWTGRKGDRIYRLFIQRPPTSTDEKMISMLKDVAAGFSLIDPDYRGDAAPPPLSRLDTNAAVGIDVDFSKAADWTSDANPVNVWKGHAAYKHGIVAVFYAVSVPLPEPLEPEAALDGVLALVGGSEKTDETGRGSDGDIAWRSYECKRPVQGTSIPTALKIGTDGKRLWYAIAWSIIDAPEFASAVRDAVAATTFTPAAGPDLPRAAAAGRLYNQLGVTRYRKDDAPKAFYWFVESLKQAPEAVRVRNALNAARNAKLYAEGLDALRTYGAVLEKGDREAARLEADLLVGIGDEPAAAEAWDRLFAGGYRDDDLLSKAVDTLVAAKLHPQALALVEKYASNKRKFEAVRVDLLIGAGETEQAIKLLEPSGTEKRFDYDRAEKYVKLLLKSGRPHDAVEAVTLMTTRQPDEARGWYWKGRVEEDTGRLDLAKRSLQKGRELAPGEQAIAEVLERVNAALGQGDDGLVRTPVEAVEVDKGLTAVPTDLEAISKDQPCRYDYWVTAVRFVPGKPLRKTIYDRATVLDRRGAEVLGTYGLSFDPASERLYINSFDVIAPDGTRRSMDRNTFFVRTARAGSSKRSLIVPVEGLTPGASIEVVATYEDLGYSQALPFALYVMSDATPVGRRAVVLFAPPDQATFQTTCGLEPAVAAGVTTFVRERCEPETDEAFEPQRHTIAPFVAFGSPSHTWEKEATDYLALIKTQLDGADSKQVAALAATLVPAGATVRQKIEALTAYAQRELRYEAIMFGRRAQIPETCDQTLSKKFGDCKAKSLLLHGLLKAAGVRSSLALVLSEGVLFEQIADIDQFDHMIVHIDEPGEERFVDATNDDSAALISAVALGGQRALVLDGGNIRFETVPAENPGDASVSIRRTVTHGADRSTVTEEITFNGRFAGMWRGSLATRDRTQTLQMLSQNLEESGVDARIEEFSVDRQRDYQGPLVAHLTYSVPRSAGDTPDAAWPCWERLYAQLPTVQNRKRAFWVRYPMAVESVTRVKESSAPAFAPIASLKPGVTDLKVTQDGDDAVYTLAISRIPGSYPVEDYDSYRAAVNRVLAAFGQAVQPSPSRR